MTLNGHEHYMRLAIKQAELAGEKGEVPAGCVIVSTKQMEGYPAGSIIGRAHNQVEMLHDPTAHSEMIAITQAAGAAGDWRLTDTTLYVTKEPCPMCAGAIIHARIPLVVFGVTDPQRGGAVSAFNILNHPAMNHRCDIVSGVLEQECRSILQDFFKKARAREN